MHTKILFAIILILNHSLLLGEIQAAEMPDEAHPFGHESANHLHEVETESHHAHLLDALTSHGHQGVDHEHHEQHHEHGMHIHLTLALPDDLTFDTQKQSVAELPIYRVSHQNQTYTPPLPPPTL